MTGNDPGSGGTAHFIFLYLLEIPYVIVHFNSLSGVGSEGTSRDSEGSSWNLHLALSRNCTQTAALSLFGRDYIGTAYLYLFILLYELFVTSHARRSTLLGLRIALLGSNEVVSLASLAIGCLVFVFGRHLQLGDALVLSRFLGRVT